MSWCQFSYKLRTLSLVEEYNVSNDIIRKIREKSMIVELDFFLKNQLIIEVQKQIITWPRSCGISAPSGLKCRVECHLSQRVCMWCCPEALWAANKVSSRSYTKSWALETEQVGWQKSPKALQKPVYSTDCSSIEEIRQKAILEPPWVSDPK